LQSVASGLPWLCPAFAFRARSSVSIPSSFPGPRGIPPPAFGYGAPHSSARRTSTLLNNALFSAHYDPFRRPDRPASFQTSLEVRPSTVLGLPQLPRSLSRHAVLTTPADRTGVRIGCFPVRAAFSVFQSGRHPRLHFRGLLKLHSRYGLPVCSPTIRGLCYEASIRPVPNQIALSVANK
jgi:hypothetical protein